MITQPSDYKFVDFANGSMYTGGFNGNILPLRQGGERNIVKAEDIAFLHECIADKAGAFNGSYILGYGLLAHGATLTPTQSISNSQVLGIYNYLKDELALGFSPTYQSMSYRGYLARYLKEISAYGKSADAHPRDIMTNLLNYISQTRGGVWTPTASESDFAASKPLEVAPIGNTFDDAKHLDKPTCSLWGTTRYFDLCSWVQTGGSPVQRPSHAFLWDMYNPLDDPSSAYQGWSCIPNNSTATLAEVPDDYLRDAQLWLVYSAVCFEDNGQSRGESSAAGVIYMDTGGYCAKAHALNKITWKQATINSTHLLDRIISDCGWTRKTIGSDLFLQQIYIYDMMFVLVGIPNARTKWWT